MILLFPGFGWPVSAREGGVWRRECQRAGAQQLGAAAASDRLDLDEAHFLELWLDLGLGKLWG